MTGRSPVIISLIIVKFCVGQIFFPEAHFLVSYIKQYTQPHTDTCTHMESIGNHIEKFKTEIKFKKTY